MKNRFKKWFISTLVMTMLLSSMPFGLAAAATKSAGTSKFTDISKHWASNEINKWSSKGLVTGYGDGSFKPDATITRAEFVVMISRVFGYTVQTQISFKDVKASDWYSGALSKAVAAGIVSGYDNNTFGPVSPITRQEAAVIIARAFDLVAQDVNYASRFNDANRIANWSKNAISAMAEGGYVSGRGNGAFEPEASITRAETVKMLSNVAGEVENSANTYTGQIATNLVINTQDVILKDMTIQGNLYITPGVGDGDVLLDNVTIKGKTIIRGGGENSIVINNSSLEGTLVVIKMDGKVRIVAKGTTDIPQVQMNSGAKLQEENLTGKGFGDVQILQTVSAGQEIKLDGDFSNVSIEASGVIVQVLDGSVASLDVKSGTTGSTIKVENGAVVTEFTTHSPVVVNGTGKIKNANINVNGVKMVTRPDRVNLASGITADIPEAINPGNGFVGGGGGGESTPPPATAAEVAATITTIEAPLRDVALLTLPTVQAGYTVAIKSSDNEGVIALNGTIVPPSAATTVNLVLEVTKTSDNTKASTASIAVVVPAKSVVQQTAAEVAAAITTIAAPAKDATMLVLPTVQAGYTVAIKSSDNEGVIALNGTIVPPSAATTVNLVLEVTRTSDNTKASTASIAVIVPAKTKVTDIGLKQQGYNYVSDISEDSISVTSGNTYIYTVDTADTPAAGLTTLTVNTVGELFNQITSKTSTPQTYAVKGTNGTAKNATSPLVQGDVLTVSAGPDSHDYTVNVIKGALRGEMQLVNSEITANTPSDVILNFFAGMRSPAVEVVLNVPKGINATLDNTKVNVIGRGDVKLSGLATQSVGRVGEGYRFPQVGTVTIDNNVDGSQVITFKGLDLRPANGADLQITFEDVTIGAGSYDFEASYKTSEPEVLTSPSGSVRLNVVNTVSNFNRVLDKSLTYKETADTYTKATFSWSAAKSAASIKLMQSTDKGITWTASNALVATLSNEVEVANLTPNTEYYFKLVIAGGENAGDSNIAKFYTGKFNAKLMGAKGDGNADDTQAINDAILYLNSLGGGTLLFENGRFNVRTVHLKSNVYLYINGDATISALKGADAPESAYFSDKAYRSGTSATDTGPYRDPENYMTKQDVGHTYFRNAMFFAEREDNFKIIGNGRITGNNNLTTSDGVMNNSADNRTDKMVTAKLCTNFEFGGLDNGLDLWYEETSSPTTDEPYYIKSIDPDGKNEVRQKDISNMLRVDKAGHFALLATGSEYINTHDFYYGKDANGSARDVFDYMGSSYVTAKNIYAKGVSDDIVKPGSDSSLGFTKPATTYYVRNIIGDTNCNLFQIGSETVDDIKNLYVDNIYVLAGNKAGFSISTNDGGHIENVYLNYGKTGTIHHKSEMRRTRAPFFISISNRGRVIGGEAIRMKFEENGKTRDELLSTNVNIGLVKNIYIKDVNIEEVYQGSQYSNPNNRWVPYGSQAKATPIIAGYKVGNGGPKLPDGRSIGYIENLNFTNVDVLVKGGNSFADSEINPPELGVGKYNIGDIGEQPSYGFWARHVEGLTFTNVTTRFEKNDDRYAIVLDDVKNATVDNMTMVSGTGNPNVIQLKNASNVTIKNSSYYKNTWGNALTALTDISNVTVPDKQTYPNQLVKNLKNTVIMMMRSGHPNITALDTTNFTITATFGATVDHIKNQVESNDGTQQTYSVTNSSNAAKASGIVESGDILVVTSEDGTTTQKYSIVVPMEILLNAAALPDSSIKKSSGTLSRSTTNGITYLQTSALAANEWIEFDMVVPQAGTYVVSFQYKTATTGRATVQPYVNGLPIGMPVNENGSVANVFIPVDLGQYTFNSAGIYPVRFVVTNPGSVVIDYIKLTKSEASAPSSNTDIQLKAGHPNVTAVDNSAHTIDAVNGTTVEQIVTQLESVDGSSQTYAVTEADGITARTTGVLENGDKLMVTSADGSTTVGYVIAIGVVSSSIVIKLKASGHPNLTSVDASAHTITALSGITVEQIVAQVESEDGSAQTYAVTELDGITAKTTGALVTGDKLVVTAADTTTIISYTINVSAPQSSNTDIQFNVLGHPFISKIDTIAHLIIVENTTSVTQITSQVSSADGSTQSYAVTNASDASKTSGALVSGDKLIVKAADSSTTAAYTIAVVNSVLKVNASHPNIVTVYNSDRTIIAYAGATVEQIMGQLDTAVAANSQTYEITDSSNVAKAPTDAVAAGDKLLITVQGGITSSVYTIYLVDSVYDANPSGTYNMASGITKSSGADNGTNFVQNSALNASHLQLALTTAGQWIDFTFDVAEAGDYDLVVGYKKNNNRAITQLSSIDGQDVSSPALDQYVSDTSFSGMYLANIGSAVHLEAGSHTFRFTATSISGGKNLSFDFIGLTKK